MAEHASTTSQAGAPDLYVNYLPMPVRHKRFLRVAVPITLWVLCTLTAIYTLSQPDPGPAVWDDGKSVTRTGIMVAHPYPILFTDAGAIPLVETGKRGCRDVAAFDGRRCTVTGWPLSRDGRHMLELDPTDAAIAALEASPSVRMTRPTLVGPITLRGEIVDSKCFLGAMKPGNGKTHKACATLCIKSGIPPSFVTQSTNGTTTHYLLTNPQGERLDAEAWPYIADPVEIRGELYEWAGLKMVRLSASNIRGL